MCPTTSQTISTVSVIIVNWNAGALLKDCVESVIRFGLPFVSRIIVVDNASSDGSESAVEHLPGVTLIRAGSNLGFAKACNVGASHAETEYLLFLNPDAKLISPDTLGFVLKNAHQPENAQAAIFGVKLLDAAGHPAISCAHFPSLLNTLVHATGLDHYAPSLGPMMVASELENNRKVDQIIGAFFMVRRQVFQQLNGFDEQFFVYYEEVDFSLRAQQAGWHSLFLADAAAFHLGGASSRQVRAKSQFYIQRSRLLYAHKHFGKLSLALIFLTTFFIEPLLRSIAGAFSISKQPVKEVWQAWKMLLRWLPDWIFRGVTR